MRGRGSYDGVESTGTLFLFEVQEGRERGGEEGTRVEERKGSGREVEDVRVERERAVDSLTLGITLVVLLVGGKGGRGRP